MAFGLVNAVVTVGVIVAVVAAALGYLRRFRITRAPVGLMTGRDIAVMVVVLVAIPPLYLRLPGVAVGILLAAVAVGLLVVTLRPVLGSVGAAVTSVGLVGLDIAVAIGAGDSRASLFFAVNNVVMALLAIGACNLWAQSGLRTAPVAAFAGVLVGYDVLATLVFPTMLDFVTQLLALPLTPVIGWGNLNDGVAVGLGDVLLLTLWTLVTEKGYGRRAALIGAGANVLALTGLVLAIALDVVNRPLPAMLVMGPIMVTHYLVLRRRARERTIGEYYATDAAPSLADTPAARATLMAASRLLPPPGAQPHIGPSHYVALVDRSVVGSGRTAASAARAAREAGHTEPALVVLVGTPD